MIASSLAAIALLSILAYYVLRYMWECVQINNLSKKAVFINGCDSGFGKLLALKCANAGITVFAGCLTHEAFKSLLKKYKGRIITVTSAVARVAISGCAPYCVAKFAAGAYMDALRQEMRQFGVKCCILEHGLFRTALASVDAMKQRLHFAWQRMSHEKRLEYGEDYKLEYEQNMAFVFTLICSPQIECVISSYFHAITARFPRLRYRVGWDAIFVYRALTLLPSELSDLIISMFTLLTVKPAALRNEKLLTQT